MKMSALNREQQPMSPALEMWDVFSALPKDANGVPLREHFNPMSMPRALPHIVKTHFQGPSVNIVKLVGEVARRFEHENLVGKNMFNFHTAEIKKTVNLLIASMFQHGHGVYVEREMFRNTDELLTLQSYAFPLANNDGSIREILTYIGLLNNDISIIRENPIGRFGNLMKIEAIDIGNGLPNDPILLKTR